jgi:hypothetical protein
MIFVSGINLDPLSGEETNKENENPGEIHDKYFGIIVTKTR